MASKVLVVDDEVSILRSTKALLEDMGFVVVPVSDATLILPTALRERPDIILHDVRMPGLDFERTVRAIREAPELAGTRLVVFTASIDAEDVASRVGVTRVLEKPFSPKDLLDALALSA